MLVVIDIGNTQTVLGLYDGPKLVHHYRFSTNHRRTQDELEVLLSGLFARDGVKTQNFRGAVIASVVPPLTETMANVCRHLGTEPWIVGPGLKTGMPIRYEHPKEVGADRIVNGVAGYERFRSQPGGPYGVIVIDFGTATTFDVVSPDGAYLGGAIAPGIGISTEALVRAASKLPRVDVVEPESAVGKNTVASMQAGIFYGYVGLVDGVLSKMKEELDFAPKVIATGGLSNLIVPHCATVSEIDNGLTLEGLRLIAQRNGADVA